MMFRLTTQIEVPAEVYYVISDEAHNLGMTTSQYIAYLVKHLYPEASTGTARPRSLIDRLGIAHMGRIILDGPHLHRTDE